MPTSKKDLAKTLAKLKSLDYSIISKAACLKKLFIIRKKLHNETMGDNKTPNFTHNFDIYTSRYRNTSLHATCTKTL